MSNELQRQLDLDLKVEGKGKYRCTVRLGQQILHMDVLVLEKSSARRKFLGELAAKARDQGIELDIAACEANLMQHMPPMNNASSSNKISSREILEAVGLEVLGEWPDQSIELLALHNKKRWRLPSPARWQGEEMLQLLGSEAEHVLSIDHSPPPNMLIPRDVRRAVAIAAAEAPRLRDDVMLGQGVWFQDERVVIVNGVQGWAYDGQHIEIIHRPVLNGKVLGFEPNAAWISDDLTSRVMQMTPDAARSAIGRLEALLGRWNWTHPADGSVVASLVPATLVQACWKWRPSIAIIAASDCGKSTLFQDLLRPILGRATIAVDRATEAGLRQAIGQSSAPVLIDEFDKYQHRQAILTLFRSSSRGASVLRGTRKHTAVSHSLRHIPWFAAIELGDLWGQDRNRFIRANLEPPTNRGGLVLPPAAELEELGLQLTSAAIWAILFARPLALELQQIRIPEVHGRTVECYAVAAAMSAILHHGRDVSPQVAARALQQMIRDREDLSVHSEPDHFRLLADILGQVVQVHASSGGYTSQTIAEVVAAQRVGPGRQFAAEGGTRALELIGLRVMTLRRVPVRGLFVDKETVLKRVLYNTRWATSEIDTILKRLPGAERDQQRCCGQRRPGVFLPFANCLDRLLAEDTT